MRSKIIINLAPKLQIPLDLKIFHFRKGFAFVLDLALKLSTVLVFLILGGFYLLDFTGQNSGIAVILALFGLMLSLLVVQLVKKLLAKGEMLPQVRNDLPLLFLTTIIAASLFIATAIAKTNTNIWGGADLRSLSGIAFIAYWLFFYLISVNIQGRKSLSRALYAYWLAPSLLLLGWLILFRDLTDIQTTALSLTLPASLWLLLTQEKNKLLHAINTIIPLVLLLFFANKEALFSVWISFALAFITITITRRNQLGEMFRTLDIKHKGSQGVVYYYLLSLLATLGGIFWALQNLSIVFFDNLFLGAEGLTFKDLGTLLFGNGLNSFTATKALQFANIYGAIAVIVLLAVIFIITKSTWKAFKKTGSLMNKELLLWTALNTISAALYLIIARGSSELVLLNIFVMLIMSSGIVARIQEKSLPALDTELAPRKPLWQFILRIVLLICLSAGLIYLLSSLNYITIFIKA